MYSGGVYDSRRWDLGEERRDGYTDGGKRTMTHRRSLAPFEVVRSFDKPCSPGGDRYEKSLAEA
jgi:hypothetical protein